MRWLSLLLSITLPFGSLAAKQSSSADRFSDFHAKAQASSPLKLADSSYKKLTSVPRDYSVAVLLTALDARFGCQLCTDFQPEWEVLAKSWAKGDKDGESRLIFGTLDFSNGRDTFISLGLQSAPVLLFFQPTTGPHAVPTVEAIRYDFTGPQTAEKVHEWLARHLPDRPHPGVIGVVFKAWPYILPVIQNRNVWAGLSLIGILMFTSGHMFNQIRKVPYVAGDGRGGINYFAAGFQSQFGLETQIVAFIYGVLSFATISLAVKAPRTRDPKIQQLMVIVWGVILVLMYSFLLSVFRVKNGGYPIKLPPFM
ncbi:Dolichyl-diphosphooligosaccharide-protein glycosyltransferase subunit 3 [Daldinia childiae]|uniref:Dolichyl-diphosphooligosaccharide-protein glycosyltransferase subunit 3 n=1 Tax=Daldinia childiae TaxID=326645 RepID=UPI001446242C|nr:Dolichyl-diphosphooligosaccharide-protein glycosyltransferase subunit 3 [Daldinia childiae]KAF3058058.1 Dolichyl-diphosphooligosaccharide-protein glycosyltransferase subunit 3 [Daldinia childiae]